MKKLLFVMAMIVVACTIMGCQGKPDYKAQGEQLAKQLNELCDKNDTAAVVALDDSIRALEEEIVALGDKEAIDAFRAALDEARKRCAPIVTVAKIEQGATRDEAVQPLIDDVLNGGGDINTVTNSIDAAIKKDKESKAESK